MTPLLKETNGFTDLFGNGRGIASGSEHARQNAAKLVGQMQTMPLPEATIFWQEHAGQSYLGSHRRSLDTQLAKKLQFDMFNSGLTWRAPIRHLQRITGTALEGVEFIQPIAEHLTTASAFKSEHVQEQADIAISKVLAQTIAQKQSINPFHIKKALGISYIRLLELCGSAKIDITQVISEVGFDGFHRRAVDLVIHRAENDEQEFVFRRNVGSVSYKIQKRYAQQIIADLHQAVERIPASLIEDN